MLWLDYETRSRCDLLKHGIYNYADDKSTSVLIASYAIGDGPVKRWEAWRGKTMPAELRNALKRETIAAHNASFERLITERVLKIKVPLERWYCTSYQARSAGLPASLDDVARMADPRHRKDPRGYQLIKTHSCYPWSDDEAGLIQFGEYCDRDVEVMRALSKQLPPLTDEALATWRANEVINDRGLPIDTELCELAIRYTEQELADVEQRMLALTGTRPRGTGLTQWVVARLTAEQQELCKHAEGWRLDKSVRAELLQQGVAPDVQEALELCDAVSLSSTAKFAQMRNRASSDGRLRGAFVAAGASATGRYSSWGAQLHNLPRMAVADPESVKARMQRGDKVSPQELKGMLRPAICAPRGRLIVRCDWSAIEARALPWLAGSKEALEYLEAFRDPSRDIYVEQAKAAGLSDRQAGKVVVLSLGYGGATGALGAMARAYGVSIDQPDTVVRRWRRSNIWALEFWHDLMLGMRARLKFDGVRVAGRISMPQPGCLQLPSGRALYYPGLKLNKQEDELEYYKAAKRPKATDPSWPQVRLWHGVLAENATQATCCDLLRDLTVRCEDAPIIGHVHDEVIIEGKKGDEKWLEREMTATPHWATNLPLKAEAKAAPRFGK